MNKLPISVGILSFKAYKTIENTLQQYNDMNFFSIFQEAKVFFQTFCEKDKEIAEKFNIDYEKREDNIGIQGGIEWIVKTLKSDYILFLENDFHLLYDLNKTFTILEKSLKLIQSGKIDMMRLRSRFQAGEPFGDVEKYTRIFKPQQIHPNFKDFHKIKKTIPFLKYLRPLKAKKISARALYIEQYPENICHQIKREDDYFIVDSSVLNWTNNPTLVSRELFLKLIDYANKHPSSRTVYGFQDLEKPLNCRWWRKQHFKIGVCDGIFTHRRLDR